MNSIGEFIKYTVTEERKFAWMPVKTTSGYYIWFTNYYYVEQFCLLFDKYRVLNALIYTEEEYFIEKMTNGNRENNYSMRG